MHMMRLGIFPCIGTCAQHGAIVHNLIQTADTPSITVEVEWVQNASRLATLDALIIPSAPASALRRFITLPDWEEAILSYMQAEKPLWMTGQATALIADGTLLDEKALFRRLKSSLIEGRSSTGKHRGRWFQPFWETLSIARIACDYHAPFVQWVSHDPRPTMHILAKWRDHPVVFWEKQFFYTVFSPELSGDYRIHEYFLRYLLMNRSRHG
ncbi:MAG: hypothetical protein IMX04_07505 [Candidatus Carbobacillus altaicus]|nr:hypothetical protein [Candidatus Carbobacillus altaicus]